MKKESLIERGYKQMKERHGTETLILFHVGEYYEAYYDDARTVARTTGVPLFNITAVRIPAARVPEADMANIISVMRQKKLIVFFIARNFKS